MARSAQFFRDQRRHRQKLATMKREREARRKSCEDKNAYKSRPSAEAYAAKWRRLGSPALVPYKCKWCGEWHLTKRERPWAGTAKI
jgi:hypothetical protein